jgi:hypothetical protein
MSEGNISTLRQRAPRPWPRHRDIVSDATAILDDLREVTRHCRQIAHRVVASRAARDGASPAR